MTNLNRSLVILADGQPITGYRHARLTGSDALGLVPTFFTLRIWNLSDSDLNLLLSSGQLTVLHEDSALAFGTICDLYRETVPEGKLTTIVLSAALPLWEAPINYSVAAGETVSETVRWLLDASGTGISLLSFPGTDPVRSRTQVFFGRAAECITDALSAASARCCLTPSGLCVIPAEGLPVSMTLTEKDLLEAPARTGSGRLVLRTAVTGWPLGKTVSVNWKGLTWTGLVTERSVDADNLEGNWQAGITMEVNL